MPWLNYNKPLTTKSVQYQNVKSLHSDQVKDLLKASYKRNGEAEAIGKKGGFSLDHSLSNSEHKVFVDKDGNPDVVFTGTRKASDWLTNAAVAVGLGRYTTRFRDSKKLMNDVKQKYKNKPVTTLGHSLGGGLAEYAGGDKVVTLDKAAGIGAFGKKITIKNTKYLNPIYAHDVSHVAKLNQFV